MIVIKDANSLDLEGIIDLQRRNFKDNLTQQGIKTQGFVTVRHNVELLSKMNAPYPHTIAVDNSKVVGYALTMLPALKNQVPQLIAMFDELTDLDNFVVMGQVCIDKDYRSQGIFRSMFEHMQLKFSNVVDYIVTEVAFENKRSMDAHLAIGFKQYKIRENWAIILLETNKSL